MVQKAVNNYYKLLDETIQSSTFIVLIIALLICAVGVIIPSGHASEIEFLSASESNKVLIDGMEYEVHFFKKGVSQD